MLNKKLVIILTFIIILSISSVSASADLTDEIIAADDGAELLDLDDSTESVNLDMGNEYNKIKNTETILQDDNTESADSFSQLSDILSASSIGDTIFLDKDYKYDNSTDTQYKNGIEVASITIDGNDHYIDADGQARIFIITGGNVVLRNIKFLNGNASDNGGAIDASGQNINITDCVFENNHANEKGGAAYFENGLANSKIDSEFINNSAYIGGAICSGGSISNNVIQGNFINNSALRTGGAVYINGTSLNNLYDAKFVDNKVLSNYSGGAITFSGNSLNNTFKNKFENNSAYYGGAIYFGGQADSNQFDAEFANNFAQSCGGAIFFYSMTNDNVFNSKFIANTAEIGNGGALTFKNTSKGSIFNADLINNFAYLGGAVNYRVSPSNITFNANLINNTADYGGAINFFENAFDMNFNGAFRDNTATFGGAIYVEGNASIRKAIFAGNSAIDGGAVYANGTNITIADCTFENNHANESGGAIYLSNSSVLDGLRFVNNSAAIGGGAAYISNMTNVSHCIFDGNNADCGAAIFIKDMPVPQSSNPDESYDYNDTIDDLDVNGTMDGNYTFDDLDGNYSMDGDENVTDGETDIGDLIPTFGEDEEFYYDEIADINIFIRDSTFINSRDFSRGAIYVNYFNNILIDGCLFENMSSLYAPAIYTDIDVMALLNNTCFNNLHADYTAGAIAFIDNNYVVIDNCTFKNTSSSRNGGAIYYDSNGWGFSSPVSLIAMNSRFINCSGDYGGSIVILGGGFKCNNTLFMDNCASFSGGAIYMHSDYDISIYDSNFTNNKLNYSSDEGLSFGGALFVDLAKTTYVNNSQFINNSNNAIYGYDTSIKINNSYFENNNEYLRTINTGELILGENKINGDKLLDSDDDSLFLLIVSGEGVKLDLINNTIDVSSLPSRFLASEWGWMSPFKDQNFSGGCWCFSTCASIEAALLKATGKTYDLSEQNMQKLMTEYFKYGNNHLVEAGQTTVALQYAISWIGPILDEYDRFDLIGKITRPISTNETLHIQDAIITYPRDITNDIDQIKQVILKYGTVTSDFYAVNEDPNFNANTSAFYCNETDGRDATHAVAVVGWDDNYSASNFLVTPPGDGAWIIKNSYGENQYDNGYVYVSYYDTVFNPDGGVAFLFENTENYTKNYQTDFGGEPVILNDSETYSYKNSYQSIGDDYISAVGTYFYDPDEEYSLEIYVNNELKLSQKGKSPFRGFHTIKLENQIPVKTGDNFTAVMKTHSVPILNKSRIHFNANVSFMDDGNGWKDLSLENYTAILKVYTMDTQREKTSSRINTKIECKNMTTTAVAKADGRVGKYFYVTLKDENGTALANKPIQIGFNGAKYNRVTDENGSAKLQINLGYKGLYTFAIGFLGDDDYLGAFEVAKITVNVQKAKLTAPNKSYNANAKTKSLTASFKTVNGKPISGKKISFTVNGKTYTANTNSKGVATVKVSLNKKGTYNFTVKYAGDNTFAAVSAKAKLTIK